MLVLLSQAAGHAGMPTARRSHWRSTKPRSSSQFVMDQIGGLRSAVHFCRGSAEKMGPKRGALPSETPVILPVTAAQHPANMGDKTYLSFFYYGIFFLFLLSAARKNNWKQHSIRHDGSSKRCRILHLSSASVFARAPENAQRCNR